MDIRMDPLKQTLWYYCSTIRSGGQCDGWGSRRIRLTTKKQILSYVNSLGSTPLITLEPKQEYQKL